MVRLGVVRSGVYVSTVVPRNIIVLVLSDECDELLHLVHDCIVNCEKIDTKDNSSDCVQDLIAETYGA